MFQKIPLDKCDLNPREHAVGCRCCRYDTFRQDVSDSPNSFYIGRAVFHNKVPIRSCFWPDGYDIVRCDDSIPNSAII